MPVWSRALVDTTVGAGGEQFITTVPDGEIWIVRDVRSAVYGDTVLLSLELDGNPVIYVPGDPGQTFLQRSDWFLVIEQGHTLTATSDQDTWWHLSGYKLPYP